MKKKLYHTEIDCHNGYPVIWQDGQYMYYKDRLESIVFFTQKDGEYTRLGDIYGLKQLYFSFKAPKFDKLPIKRVEKPKNEQFFFINSTLFIRAEAINLLPPKYNKRNRIPEFHTPDITTVNFLLEVTWIWDDGYYTRELLWDSQDYTDIKTKAQRQLEKLFTMPYYFNEFQDMDEAVRIIQNLEIELKERIKWWTNASIEELVAYYESKKKGGKKNA